MADPMTWIEQSGFLYNPELNRQLMRVSQPMMKFRQFVSLKSAFGKNKGDSFNWDKAFNVETPGGVLVETNTFHETRLPLVKGTLTVDEYGNSIPFTSKMDDLSMIEIVGELQGGLINDEVKCIDGMVEREFNQTPLRYVGTTTAGYALTTNGTATATNNSVLNRYHVKKIVKELKNRNVPGWGKLGGDYVAICSLDAMEGLQTDLETIKVYTETGYKKILNGEVGRYHGVRFVEDTYAASNIYNSTARTSTAKSWTNAASLDAYFFGSPTIREAVAIPEEIRRKVVTDYGRSKGVAWYFLGGWKIEWSDEPNARIVKWDSAA